MLSIEFGEHSSITDHGVREPQLLKLQSGDLLLTYHVQDDKHFADRRGKRSADGGRTWQDEPQRAHREQVIGQSKSGDIVLASDVYTFERAPGEFLGSFFRSDDGGATFTGPHETLVKAPRVISADYPEPAHFPEDDHPMRHFYQPLPDYYAPTVQRASMRRGPIFWRYLIEHQGRWITPMQCRFHGDKCHRTILVESEDDGRTWSLLSTVAYFHGEPGDGYCEPALMETPDGELLCMLRRGGRLALAQCRSSDGGRTWTEPELTPGHGVDPDVYLMSSGVLACTYGRPGNHIMFSEDGCGYAWGYRTQIGDWRSSTYMGIAEVAPDELLVIYDHNAAPPEAGRAPEQCSIGSVRLRVKRSANPCEGA